jgi:hypothetical protein
MDKENAEENKYESDLDLLLGSVCVIPEEGDKKLDLVVQAKERLRKLVAKEDPLLVKDIQVIPNCGQSEADFFVDYYCPACGERGTCYDFEDLYCHHCGHRLDLKGSIKSKGVKK